MSDVHEEPAEDGISLSIDFDGRDLTLNERIQVEEACGGVRFEQLREEGRSTYLRAVAWVVGRRTDRRLSIEEAGELQVRFDG